VHESLKPNRLETPSNPMKKFLKKCSENQKRKTHVKQIRDKGITPNLPYIRGKIPYKRG
jgi:hypothetical protein